VCKWVSDWFTYVCCNADCPKVADFCNYPMDSQEKCPFFADRDAEDGQMCFEGRGCEANDELRETMRNFWRDPKRV